MGLRANTASTGLSMSLAQSLTATPVRQAEMMVPSRVPTMLPWKRISDSTTATVTNEMSVATLTLPKAKPVRSDTAYTKASPELSTTFAMTVSSIPSARKSMPARSMALCPA